MGNGFRRFIDFSPLSVKYLNDQLEQLWLKVMGGISYRDLSSDTRSIIDSKTDSSDVISVIEQNTDRIIMAVGTPGGDNVIHNGCFEFGAENWQCNQADIRDGYMCINGGYILQRDILVDGGGKYTLGFEGYGVAEVRAEVVGVHLSLDEASIAIFEVQSDNEVGRHRFNFTVPQGINSCYVRIECAGVFNIKKIYIRQGEGVNEYTSNPNEISGSDVSITQDSVSISTSDFTLNIKGEDGSIKSVLSTDGTGFDDIYCSNLTINDRKYTGAGGRHIYVNSGSGNDSNSGESTYYPFKTIARALKEIPIHITDRVTIHLSGGEYYEDIYFNYGGSGILSIMGESATLYGHIFVNGSGYAISINNLLIYTRSLYCFYGYGNSAFVDMQSCVLDCNGAAASYGIYLTHGFRMYINGVEINNCNYGIYCTKGSFLDVYECLGKSNVCGVFIDDMSVMNCEGTVPHGDTIFKEENGGRIDGFLLGGQVGSKYLVPRTTVKTATFNAISKFSYDGNGMIGGVLKQGRGYGAILVFDTNAIATALNGRIIKSVKLIVKRRGDDGITYDGILKAYSHNISSGAGGFSYVDSYGNVGIIKRGEQVSIEILPDVISKITAGTVKGILFYDNSQEKSYIFELDSGFASRLEVLYV